MVNRFRFMTVAFFGFLTAVVLFSSSPAYAHNALETSDPANGSILTTRPSVWTLSFSSVVPIESASGEIIFADGTRTALEAPTQGANTKQISFALPPNISGAVTGRWKLVGTDGHVVTSRVKFTVQVTTSTTTLAGGNTSPTTTVAPVAASTTTGDDNYAPESLRLTLRLFGYAAILLIGGLLFTDAFIARGVLRAPRARETLFVSTGMLAVTPLLQTMIFLDDSRDFGIVNSFFHLLEAFDTTAGSMTFIRFLTGLSLAVGLVRISRDDSLPLFHPVTGSLSFLYLVSLAYTGHSRSMAWPVLGVPADIVHTAAVAIWMGGLVVFIAFVIPTLSSAESFAAFRRFGDAATYAVIAMVVTGVIQTVRLHGTFVTLFTQTHGRWLILKLVFVALMLKIGDINRRRLVRALPTNETDFAKRVWLLRRASITELASGALVMLITAVLVSASFN